MRDLPLGAIDITPPLLPTYIHDHSDLVRLYGAPEIESLELREIAEYLSRKESPITIERVDDYPDASVEGAVRDRKGRSKYTRQRGKRKKRRG